MREERESTSARRRLHDDMLIRELRYGARHYARLVYEAIMASARRVDASALLARLRFGAGAL